eukprot:SAG31_NODE_31310_length_369_cov_1.344444_2_plen_22_part_01
MIGFVTGASSMSGVTMNGSSLV